MTRLDRATLDQRGEVAKKRLVEMGWNVAGNLVAAAIIWIFADRTGLVRGHGQITMVAVLVLVTAAFIVATVFTVTLAWDHPRKRITVWTFTVTGMIIGVVSLVTFGTVWWKVDDRLSVGSILFLGLPLLVTIGFVVYLVEALDGLKGHRDQPEDGPELPTVSATAGAAAARQQATARGGNRDRPQRTAAKPKARGSREKRKRR